MDFSAGAGQIDITPAEGIHLGGDLCRHRPVDRVVDPIYAKALVIEDGPGTRLCFLSLDLCVISSAWAGELRDVIGQRFGLPREAVMVHCVQNHSAPSIGDLLFRPNSPFVPPECWWISGSDPDYPAFVEPKILETVEQALSSLEPVTLRHTNGVDGRIGFNRRYIKRDGTVQTLPRAADLPDILQVEGPTDPEVAVVACYGASGEMTAALLHHTAHPVSLWNTNHVTASWPGRWCDKFRDAVGGACVPLIVNGCCGNINVANPLDRDRKNDDDTVSAHLMQTTQDALKRFVAVGGEPTLDFRSKTLDIPRPEFDPKELDDARELLNKCPTPRWYEGKRHHVDPEWAFAALLLDMAENYQQNPLYPYEVQALRIGDLALVGLMGEPFVEGQLAIKLSSPAARTLVAHQCNGYLGYLPTRHGAERFNYNYYTPEGLPVRRGATRLVLVPEAMDLVLDAARELLTDLWNG